MLTYVPQGVNIPEDGILNGAQCNDMGHGWAVADNKQIIVGKSMDYVEALRDFKDTRSLMPGSAGIFHSRLATHGAVSDFNTHPFWVSEKAVVAHNGIMPKVFQPTGNDPRSDTRVFADLVKQTFTNNEHGLPSRRGAQHIADLIGINNKLVFLGSTPQGPKVRIVNEFQGVQSGGVWYSNSDFKGNTWKYGYSYGHTNWSKYSWSNYKPALPPANTHKDDCPACGSFYVDSKNRICKVCYSCLDCNMNVAADCMCWVPATKDTPWWNEEDTDETVTD